MNTTKPLPVKLSELSAEVVMKTWRYSHPTEANGRVYHHDSLDVCAVQYASKTKVYFERNFEHRSDDKSPCHYLHCHVLPHSETDRRRFYGY